jgi:hypothetical protein
MTSAEVVRPDENNKSAIKKKAIEEEGRGVEGTGISKEEEIGRGLKMWGRGVNISLRVGRVAGSASS